MDILFIVLQIFHIINSGWRLQQQLYLKKLDYNEEKLLMILLMPSYFLIDFTGNHQLGSIPMELRWKGVIRVAVLIPWSSAVCAKGTELLSCLGWAGLPFPPWHSEIASCALIAVYRAEEFVFYEEPNYLHPSIEVGGSMCSYKIMIPDSALQIRVSLPYYREGWFQAWAKQLAARGRSLPGAASSLVCLAGRGGDGCGCSRHGPTLQPFPSKLRAMKRIEKKKHIQGGTHSTAATQLTGLPKGEVKIFGLQN